MLQNIGPEKPLTIVYDFTGCFNMGSETITIKQSGNGYAYTLKRKDTTLQGSFTKQDEIRYAAFERAGKKLSSQINCTTVSDFNLKCGSKEIYFRDGNCAFPEWGEFYQGLNK